MEEPRDQDDEGGGIAPRGESANRAQRPRQPVGTDRAAAFVRIGLLFYGLLGVAAVIWRIGWAREPMLFVDAAAAARGVSWASDLATGVAAGLALIAISHLVTRGTRAGENMARELAATIGPLGVPDALLLASASGLVEELFFRGALQPRVGWIAASLLFGLVHFVPRRSLAPWTVFAVAAGLLFGWLFERTGNLIAPIAAHTLVNAVNLPWLVKRYGSLNPEPR